MTTTELMHTWVGPQGARLLLTAHGGLWERPAGANQFVLKGRHADGAEADALANRRGYDHIGLDDATAYLPTLIDEGDTVTMTEPQTEAEAEVVAAPKSRKELAQDAYREIAKRVKEKQITIWDACREVAEETGRSPKSLEVGFHLWRKAVREETGDDPLPKDALPPASKGGATGPKKNGRAPKRTYRRRTTRATPVITKIEAPAPPPTAAPLVSGVSVVADQDELIAAAGETHTAMTEYVESMWSQLAQAETALYSRLEWVEARRKEMRAIAEVINLKLKT